VAGGVDVDVVVVGAGVVGLACAAELAGRGRSVIVLERGPGIGQETTSRNSEVVHAGIYYPADSLKARLCVEGRRLLYERCERLGIPHRKLGKWIVASTPEEIPTLESIHARGVANGVEGLRFAEAAEVRAAEPWVRVAAAVLSPETGIVDAHALCLSLLAEAEAHDALLLLRHDVKALERRGEGFAVEVSGADGEHARLRCAAVVNAAGLWSDALLALAGVDVDARGLRLHPCKGDYFALQPSAPIRVSRLVYPMPVQAGLGVHATLDLGGRIRFGPDTEYVAEPRYDVDAGKARAFAEAIAHYLPGIRAEWLTPDYAGVRPKLAGPGEGFRDFVVEEAGALGLPGLVSCVGIESPGLTAAPAIARRVADLLASP